MGTGELLQIDIRSVIEKKNPKLLKKLPGFALRFIKWILKLKEANDFLRRKGHLEKLDFAEAILEEFEITLNVEGLDNIPKDGGRYIFTGNHPLGALDSIAKMCMVGRISWIGDKIKFPANDIISVLEPFKSILLPINKHGGQAKKTVELFNSAYKSDNQILYFPAGMVSRRKWFSRKVVDVKWSKSPIKKAFEYERDIIPVYIDGKNSNRFYRIANWRKLFGLPNIEMFFLIREIYKQKGKTITIKIGKPISYEKFNPKRSPLNYDEWADKLRSTVYGLGGINVN